MKVWSLFFGSKSSSFAYDFNTLNLNDKRNREPFLKKILPHKTNDLDIAIFFRQLSVLISAGIPIVQCCETLSQSQQNIHFRKTIYVMKEHIQAGKSLTNALQNSSSTFDDMVCSIIEAGEKSGTLETMLKRVAEYKEKSLRLKKRFQQALFYPTIICSIALIVSFIMLTCIIPRFAELFNNMHGSLPTFTLWVLNLSLFLRKSYWLLLLVLIVGILIIFYFRSSSHVQKMWDKIVLRLPLVGPLFKKVVFIRFARNLSTLSTSGIPINESLTIIGQICKNYTFHQAIIILKNHVMTGHQLHSAMQMNNLFTPMAVQMVKVGEESGSLEKMLEKLAELYEADIENTINNLGHLLEPLIILMLGVLIGGLIIAMYLPIFKLGTLI